MHAQMQPAAAQHSLQPRTRRPAATPLLRRWNYKVLVCNHCRTYWNRDVNAARNILTLVCCSLLGLPRPAYLRRRPRGQG